MENENRPSAGFIATLSAVSNLEDPRGVLPLLAAALGEAPPVRRQALKFLIEWPGIEAAMMVLRGFAGLEEEDRKLALSQRARLQTAAEAVLRDQDRASRLGLVAFAKALPAPEGLAILLQLLDDPIEGVRRTAREAFLGYSRDYLDGRLPITSAAEVRRFVAGVELAIRSAGAEETALLAAGLFKASQESPKALEALKALAIKGSDEVKRAVLSNLLSEAGPAAASLVLDFLGSGPEMGERVLSILRKRRDPDFLAALAREASRRMESPAGIPASAVAALSQVAWEALPAAAMASLPSAAQKRLLAIARAFRGDLPTRARRIAVFLRSRERRLREMVLEALGDYPPATFKDELVALLNDPADELQIRAAELLARVGTPECRRILLEKAQKAGERLRRFIHGRLASAGYLATDAGVPAPVAAARAELAAGPFEEYSFPVLRPGLYSKMGGGR
jgi:hypothetical protein